MWCALRGRRRSRPCSPWPPLQLLAPVAACENLRVRHSCQALYLEIAHSSGRFLTSVLAAIVVVLVRARSLSSFPVSRTKDALVSPATFGSAARAHIAMTSNTEDVGILPNTDGPVTRGRRRALQQSVNAPATAGAFDLDQPWFSKPLE